MIPLILSDELICQLDLYRARREEETGKRPFRHSAIIELLEERLADVKPARPVADRLNELEARLAGLEARVDLKAKG